MKHIKKILFFICLVGLLVSIFLFKNTSKRPGNLSLISEGLNTCFARVVQTNTASILGFSSSLHLSSSFLEKTETCFADVSLQAGENRGEFFASLVSQINLLASDAHWFFEKMTKNPSSMTQDQSSQNTKSTFLKLENSYFNLLTEIESQREKENLKLSLYQKSLHLNIALIFLCLVMGVISFFKFLKKRSGIEKNAEKELNLKEDLNQKSAKEILSTALDFADLPKCQHLLDEFTKNALYGKKDKKEKLEKIEADLNLEKAPIVQAPYETILPSTPRAVKSEEIKESSISDVSSFKEEDNKIDVPEILAQIIEQLSIQFFAKGIKLEINVAADLSLDWEKDAFEQILYEAITRTLSINPTHMFLDFEEEAKVTVFKVSFMARSELSKGMIQDHFSLASTFMSEFGGVIKYIEIEKFHFSVDLYFTKDLETKKKKTKSKKELVRFRKASKRELQAQLFN